MSNASYTIKYYADGQAYVKTRVFWDRTFGKADRRTFSKSGEIYTRSKFLIWCKKYKVTPTEEELKELPTKI